MRNTLEKMGARVYKRYRIYAGSAFRLSLRSEAAL